MNVENIWIGRRKITGAGGVYAYDPDIQVGSARYVYLFDFHVGWPQKFVKKNLRNYFTAVSNDEGKDVFINKYINCGQ